MVALEFAMTCFFKPKIAPKEKLTSNDIGVSFHQFPQPLKKGGGALGRQRR